MSESTGHYIVVCGYNQETDQILYKDPAQTEGMVFSSIHMTSEAEVQTELDFTRM